MPPVGRHREHQQLHNLQGGHYPYPPRNTYAQQAVRRRPAVAQPPNGIHQWVGRAIPGGVAALLLGRGGSPTQSPTSGSNGGNGSGDGASSPPAAALMTAAGLQQMELEGLRLSAASHTPLPPQLLQQSRPLKHLSFVQAHSSYWLALVSNAYTLTTRYCVPLPTRAITAIESTVASNISGVRDAALHKSEEVLYAVDDCVESVVKNGEGLLAELSKRAPVRFAAAVYGRVHHTVVANPAYTRVVELGEGALDRVHQTVLYKQLVPLVGPYTDPLARRIMQSPTFQAVRDHLAPVSASASVADSPELNLAVA